MMKMVITIVKQRCLLPRKITVMFCKEVRQLQPLPLLIFGLLIKPISLCQPQRNAIRTLHSLSQTLPFGIA